MQLVEKSEIIGIPTCIKKVDGIYKITFTFHREIEIPVSKIKSDELKDLIGNKAGILHIGNRYKIRRIKK